MTKVQLDLTDKADTIVMVFKAKTRLKTKQEAINQILEMHGDLL